MGNLTKARAFTSRREGIKDYIILAEGEHLSSVENNQELYDSVRVNICKIEGETCG